METIKFKILVVSLFSVVLGGCTISTPVVITGNYEGMKNLNPKKGTVYVYRDDSYFGAVNQYDVMHNGLLVGSGELHKICMQWLWLSTHANFRELREVLKLCVWDACPHILH